jgi:hypothetical protein
MTFITKRLQVEDQDPLVGPNTYTKYAWQAFAYQAFYARIIMDGYFGAFSTGYWISVTVSGSVWLPFRLGRR